MKTLIVCSSMHRGNTKMIAEAMADILDADLMEPQEADLVNLDQYDLIGFGSGVYGGKPHKSIEKFVFGLPRFRDMKAFVFSTSWRGKLSYNQFLKNKLTEKGFDVLDDFTCRGFNCFGPFKLIGGLNKGRPNKEDIENAVDFAQKLKS